MHTVCNLCIKKTLLWERMRNCCDYVRAVSFPFPDLQCTYGNPIPVSWRIPFILAEEPARRRLSDIKPGYTSNSNSSSATESSGRLPLLPAMGRPKFVKVSFRVQRRRSSILGQFSSWTLCIYLATCSVANKYLSPHGFALTFVGWIFIRNQEDPKNWKT